MPATVPTRMTYHDYCQIPVDGNRYEVIEGVLHMSPAPTPRHQQISNTLSTQLTNFVQQAGLGRIYTAPIDVVFSDFDVVQPDILFISCSRLSIVDNKNIQGSPDLVVEILSEGNRRQDEVVKRKLYERYQVPEYWIVDPELETVKVYRLAGDRFGEAVLFSIENEDMLESPLLPGLQFSLKDIFPTS